jgi:hypothetical protein
MRICRISAPGLREHNIHAFTHMDFVCWGS